MSLSLVTDRKKEDVEYLLSLIAKGWGGMTSAEQSAWSAMSLKGAYNYTDFNRVENAVAYLLPILQSAGYDLDLTTKNTWAVNNDVRVADAARYLLNIAEIRRAFTYFNTTPQAPTSLVGLSYAQANDIEQILLDCEYLIFKLLRSWSYSGDLYSGETITFGSYLPLEAYSWSEINDIGNLGLAPILFALNSRKDWFEIVGFNIDNREGGGTANYTFAEKGVRNMPSYNVMNFTNTNLTGWENCFMRGATQYLAINPYVKYVLKPTQRSGSIVLSRDRNFLFSEVEITGSNSASMAGEGTHYPGFTAIRKDELFSGAGIVRDYWTRSPALGGTTRFVYITSAGGISTRDALNPLSYISWGLCI